MEDRDLPSSILRCCMPKEHSVATQTNIPPLQVGVIGAGWPGERHAEGYGAIGTAKVVAVSDLDAGRRPGRDPPLQEPRTKGDHN
jgi:hypothetical protein